MAISQSFAATKRSVTPVTISELVGVSPWARNLRRQVLHAAATDATVLISGPTGTGKELIANALHAHSRRAEHPFIPVDCTCLIGDLFPSHMFGHLRGAFTGAHCESLGCFRAADGGTIFLDEIGELELIKQAKLLRVLEERMVVPVGGVSPIPVNVRIVAATNRDLSERIKGGRFRQDLFYRLHVLELRTLALKDHREDICVLVSHFLAKLCAENALPAKAISPAALALLTDHDWPGNVRQLRNVLERAVLYSESDVIGPDAFQALLESADASSTNPPALELAAPTAASSLPPVIDAAAPHTCPTLVAAPQSSTWPTLAQLEREHLQRTLHHTLDNRTAAAELLGITPRILARLIKKHGISTPGSHRGRPPKAKTRLPATNGQQTPKATPVV